MRRGRNTVLAGKKKKFGLLHVVIAKVMCEQKGDDERIFTMVLLLLPLCLDVLGLQNRWMCIDIFKTAALNKEWEKGKRRKYSKSFLCLPF